MSATRTGKELLDGRTSRGRAGRQRPGHGCAGCPVAAVIRPVRKGPVDCENYQHGVTSRSGSASTRTPSGSVRAADGHGAGGPWLRPRQVPPPGPGSRREATDHALRCRAWLRARGSGLRAQRSGVERAFASLYWFRDEGGGRAWSRSSTGCVAVLRPAEVIHLRLEQCHCPSGGEGCRIGRGQVGVVTSGTDWTDDGEAAEVHSRRPGAGQPPHRAVHAGVGPRQPRGNFGWPNRALGP